MLGLDMQAVEKPLQSHETIKIIVKSIFFSLFYQF